MVLLFCLIVPLMSSRKQLQQGKKEAQTQEQQPKEEREPQELPLNCPPLSGEGQGQARHKKPVAKQPTSTQAQGLAAARVFQDALFCLLIRGPEVLDQHKPPPPFSPYSSPFLPQTSQEHILPCQPRQVACKSYQQDGCQDLLCLSTPGPLVPRCP